jgi:hypothetical protein
MWDIRIGRRALKGKLMSSKQCGGEQNPKTHPYIKDHTGTTVSSIDIGSKTD